MASHLSLMKVTVKSAHTASIKQAPPGNTYKDKLLGKGGVHVSICVHACTVHLHAEGIHEQICVILQKTRLLFV